MAYKDLTPQQKIVAVHTDMMRNADFAILGGVSQIGDVKVTDDMEIPTAGTDGCDVYYNVHFIADMTRKQLRYLVAHENMHKALHHCTEYKHLKEKHPQEFGMAIDYVVNWQLESMDTKKDFLERPTTVPPLIDDKYANMSVPEVMRHLLQNPPPQQGKGGKASGSGAGQPMDVHIMRAKSEGDDAAQEEADTQNGKDLKTRIEDAVAQGTIVAQQMRGTSAGSADLSGFKERATDWRGPLRKFIADICEGDDQSRYAPPNRRLLPLDIIMPSHFSEATGELVIACDTSGSMAPLYAMVFGEIANICKQAVPAGVRVLWWDTRVSGDQKFLPKDYDKLRNLLKPVGGGGTTISCVAQYMRQHRIKPKATIMLTDGYVEANYESPEGNLLWGVCGNSRFVPRKGKRLLIEEV